MRRRNLGWFFAAAILALIVSASAPAFPQEAGANAPAPPAAAPKPESEQTVEKILREQEQLLSGQRFSYDPAGRRDPFR